MHVVLYHQEKLSKDLKHFEKEHASISTNVCWKTYWSIYQTLSSSLSSHLSDPDEECKIHENSEHIHHMLE